MKMEIPVQANVFLPARTAILGAVGLGADVIIKAKGGEHTLTQIPCESYDVKLVDEDGDVCEVPKQDVCGEHQTWELTSEDLLACQSRQ